MFVVRTEPTCTISLSCVKLCVDLWRLSELTVPLTVDVTFSVRGARYVKKFVFKSSVECAFFKFT